MKSIHKISIFSFLLLSVTGAKASVTAEPDTVLIVNNPSQITITESPTAISLSVKGTADDPSFMTSFTNEYQPDAMVTVRQRFTPPPFITVSNNTKIDTDYSPHALSLLSGIHAGFCTPSTGPPTCRSRWANHLKSASTNSSPTALPSTKTAVSSP